MVKADHKPMNYQALEVLLSAFGFQRLDLPQEDAILFRHLAKEARVIVTKGLPTDSVPLLDLITVRRTILEKGIASSEDYELAIQEGKTVRTPKTQTRPRPLSTRRKNKVVHAIA